MISLIFSIQYCTNADDSDTAIVLIHGFGVGTWRMRPLQKLLNRDWPDRTVINLDILTGALSSIFENPERYVRAAADEIRTKTFNFKCIDLVVHSQGGFVGRSYLQLYSNTGDYPGVRNFIAMSSVQGGYYRNIKLADKIINSNNYQLIVPTGYWRNPNLSNANSLLNTINGNNGGPIPGHDQILNLKQFVCFYSYQDEVLKPPTTSRFDFYDQNLNVVELENQNLYVDLGLKQLFDQGRFKTFEFTGFKHGYFVKQRINDVWTKCLKGLLSGGSQACGSFKQ
ncbi:Palmitoyl-protein_thioesterase [Hexamita inflata]|uniref:Palmitoyl-protein thioesterase n=1 Tax=Hexamita inflata TaxID=28002 RepID=A0AA86UY97_9EUKA|nr:Palmitoyl-protein thioesterase [Hexamita inflata]